MFFFVLLSLEFSLYNMELYSVQQETSWFSLGWRGRCVVLVLARRWLKWHHLRKFTWPGQASFGAAEGFNKLFTHGSLEIWKEALRCNNNNNKEIQTFHCKDFTKVPKNIIIETESQVVCVHYCRALYDPVDTAHHAAARAALLNGFSGRLDISRLAGLFPPSFSELVFGCAPQAAAQHKGSYCRDLIQGLHSFSNMVG